MLIDICLQVRVLRPLRLIQRWSGMRLVVETLIQSAPAVSQVVLFGMFQFVILAILCVQLFAGGLSVCSQVSELHDYDGDQGHDYDPSTSAECTTTTDCSLLVSARVRV